MEGQQQFLRRLLEKRFGQLDLRFVGGWSKFLPTT